MRNWKSDITLDGKQWLLEMSDLSILGKAIFLLVKGYSNIYYYGRDFAVFYNNILYYSYYSNIFISKSVTIKKCII